MRIFKRINRIKNVHGFIKVRIGISIIPERIPLHPTDSNARTYYWTVWFSKWKFYGGVNSRWLFKYWKGCRLLWLDKNHKPRDPFWEDGDK